MVLNLKDKKKIIIKIGSSLLINKEGVVNISWLKSLAQDILILKSLKKEVVIVSSGAIALGKSKLKVKNNKLTLVEKQASCAVGQIALMSHYQECFSEVGLDIAQILLTGDDATDRNRYLNARNTFNSLLKNGIIPIVNENDTVAIQEIKIGDNDRLAARVAQIVDADLLILLSDIDGLYNKNPKIHQDAKFIDLIEDINDDIEKMAGDPTSSIGTGGMVTKIKAAKMAFNLGCDCIITNGDIDNPIKRIIDQKARYSLFRSSGKKINARRQWIADCLNVSGGMVVNKRAAEAILENASLLPIGVVQVIGSFNKGDVVFIKDLEGYHIANGIVNYTSLDAKIISGKNSLEIKNYFNKNKKELVHRDDLVLL